MSEDRRFDEDLEGAEPLEEVGPADCEAKPTMTEKRVVEMSTLGVADSEHRSDDEVAEQFPVEPIPMIPHPLDGIPVPADERHGIAKAPPFTYEHVVCVEDDREFVEVFFEEFDDYKRYNGKLFRELAQKVRFRSRFQNGLEREREVFRPDETSVLYGRRVFRIAPVKKKQTLLAVLWGWLCSLFWLRLHRECALETYILLRPVRERCIHYKRQVFSNDEVTDEKAYGHKIVFRNCTFRRSVGGAFMSLRDEAVYACDYREPRDPGSIETHIDEPDRMRLRSRAHLHLLPLFGVTGEPSTIVPSPNGKKGVVP